MRGDQSQQILQSENSVVLTHDEADQRNQMKGTEINPTTYKNPAYDKQSNACGKEGLSQKWCWDNWTDLHSLTLLVRLQGDKYYQREGKIVQLLSRGIWQYLLKHLYTYLSTQHSHFQEFTLKMVSLKIIGTLTYVSFFIVPLIVFAEHWKLPKRPNTEDWWSTINREAQLHRINWEAMKDIFMNRYEVIARVSH